jgi:hypothetical protein
MEKITNNIPQTLCLWINKFFAAIAMLEPVIVCIIMLIVVVCICSNIFFFFLLLGQVGELAL